MYQFYKQGFGPWTWDLENYSGDRAYMVGFFYPEDAGNIKQIMQYEIERNNRNVREQNAQMNMRR